ncbi:tetratricopeptide repeat protein [Actinoplanes flavus]|uniref:Tetratricopeptide repeat protein n=1 Tax=Actinoplanes flavus TaxID=2820290 RepID=A0ABS3UVP9_9ACTN|nr:tetratricopeptide repeat protein [Actinoplanes flavus]MBO3742642.1 tetratricopeptide repeat protein [Actinoplanes flavus]
MTTTPAPADIAFSLLREGRFGDAENLMAREVQAAADKHGHGSPQWASAQCDLGNVLLNADQLPRAIECFRQAASVTPVDQESHKDQLTYRLNVGMALRMAGRLEEAEEQLRQGVQERLAFYGREHAGYAFGLEPLASLLLERGDVGGARQVVEETVAIFWNNGHERVASALALRAAVVQAGGTGEPLFIGLEQLPDHVVEQIGRVVTQLPVAGAAARKELITTVVAVLEQRLGADHQGTINALSALANLGRDSGDQAGRVEAIERVLASYERQGRTEEALMAELGLAMARDDAGDSEGSLRAYASAYERSQLIGRPEVISQVLRNWGLALRDAGRTGPAEQRLTQALEQARRGADHDTVGRAGVALGLFLQHEGRLDEARTILEEGLAVMDPVHPDALVGRSHLSAVRDGRTCGCGDMPSTIAEAFREFVITRLPGDLLDRLEVAIVDNDFKIDVHLRREPTEAELGRLNEVFATAQAEFRHRITDRS